MIIPNGTIAFKEKHGGGIDPATGYPVAATATWGDPIPAQILPGTRSLLATAGGERITKAAYSVLIEWQTLPQSEQVRLTWQDGTEIGEFSMAAPVEWLLAVGQIKISV